MTAIKYIDYSFPKIKQLLLDANAYIDYERWLSDFDKKELQYNSYLMDKDCTVLRSLIK